MRRYEVFPDNIDLLSNRPALIRRLGETEVAVAIKAVSLNFRDILVTRNTYFAPISGGLVPCSDGAGEVVAVGSQVQGLAVGDRVATCSSPLAERQARRPGAVRCPRAESAGAFTERFVSDERGLIKLPDGLSYAEGHAALRGSDRLEFPV
jgi:NADPH:quinone reductase-like Zn-dependent oxidoreductase